LVLCLDARLLAEYDEVLARPNFGFDPDSVAAFLDYVDFKSEVVASQPLSHRLPDLDDEPFLEVALEAGAECVVTGNLAHFPAELRAGASVLSPTEFMVALRGQGLAGDI